MGGGGGRGAERGERYFIWDSSGYGRRQAKSGAASLPAPKINEKGRKGEGERERASRLASVSLFPSSPLLSSSSLSLSHSLSHSPFG